MQRRALNRLGALGPRPRWRRLRWTLTLSFTLVTVTAVTVLFVAYGAFVVQRESGPDAFALRLRYLPVFVAALGERLEPHLGDPEQLARLLEDTYDEQLGISERNPLVVVDTRGTVLAALGSSPPVGTPVEAWLEPGALAPVRAALSGAAFSPPDPLTSAEQPWIDWWSTRRTLAGDRRAPIVATTSPSSFTVSVPLMDPLTDDARIAGALLYRFDLADERGFIFRIVSEILLIGLSIATGLAVVSGTVFGFLYARHLTRRLTQLSGAATAWSRGDFSVRAPTTPHDELGQLAERLNQMAAELRALLAARQEFAILEERNRLALDLHDSVKQQAFAAAMQVSAARARLADPGAADRHLGEAEALAHQIQQELGELVRELRPTLLRGSALVATVEHEVARWSRQSGIGARVDGARVDRLAMPQTLLRVLHEALANIARHSRATEVSVRLEPCARSVVLSVSDNGVGFDPAAARGRGVGLASMRERLERYGGSFSLDSRPGHGTRLVARWPLPDPHSAPHSTLHNTPPGDPHDSD